LEWFHHTLDNAAVDLPVPKRPPHRNSGIDDPRGADALLSRHDRPFAQAGQGEFDWSSQRSIGEGCNGQAEGVGVGSDGPAGDAFAGASAGGAS
jgi:hypothetical protein